MNKTNTQVLRLSKAFPNGSSANIKFSKTQLSKTVQLGGFLFWPHKIPSGGSLAPFGVTDSLLDSGIKSVGKEMMKKGFPNQEKTLQTFL